MFDMGRPGLLLNFQKKGGCKQVLTCQQQNEHGEAESFRQGWTMAGGIRTGAGSTDCNCYTQ